jgi:hypothetical protein
MVLWTVAVVGSTWQLIQYGRVSLSDTFYRACADRAFSSIPLARSVYNTTALHPTNTLGLDRERQRRLEKSRGCMSQGDIVWNAWIRQLESSYLRTKVFRLMGFLRHVRSIILVLGWTLIADCRLLPLSGKHTAVGV